MITNDPRDIYARPLFSTINLYDIKTQNVNVASVWLRDDAGIVNVAMG